ncbi:DtxR family Mn-dependent transcriptional regulator [Methanohalophilus levihalophilus]|uniref:metal-dependent transcriptional regulator n=1 Tax=Methanohalophilus levihalophilus TaxID=1431282 RepID=UPI001AE38DD5|nr:metal-dependent transcriptional regulator [Methanohalophilus levihalophilus]MBP2030606.1 DtxR family Mn-dependent transcriptional regulator [Methanohalophilus levihalophilus]
MATGKTEEYLETILSLISKTSSPAKNKDIANELDIAPATATEMIQRLSDEGFVKYIPYKGVELTDEGIRKATELQHRHNILRDFLSQVLRIDDVAADREACVLEHSASELVVESMLSYMEEKGVVRKHIADISDTCRSTDGDYVRLNDLHEGEMATVALIHLPKSDRDRLTSLGMVTGEDIEIKRRQKQGCLSILTKGTEIALGKDIANKIFVMLKGQHYAGGEVD